MTYPDITSVQSVEASSPIERAGMEGIEARMRDSQGHFSPIKVDVYANLSKLTAKGLHMSRLYIETLNALEKEPLSEAMLATLLERLLDSHLDLSDVVSLRFHTTFTTMRNALKSENTGLRHYPVRYWAQLSRDRGLCFESYAEVQYSATCPCSAALARQLMAEHFNQTFANKKDVTLEQMTEWLHQEDSQIATPHAQRSIARVWVNRFISQPQEWIDVIENALQTPVQSAVKRADEQEFARLNARNLMFAEDAARRVHKALAPDFQAIKVKVEHYESLHPHNAVAQMGEGLWQC
jgi:GTP cyclohydrolase IB